jgi:hypothetical protein
VEEGVIAELHPEYSNRWFSGDDLVAIVQNTGDTPITIIGGFVNGIAAAKTYNKTLAVNSEALVWMVFPWDSLFNLTQNGVPYEVKLTTATGYNISYAEQYYYPKP